MAFSCLRLAILGAAVAQAVRVDEDEVSASESIPEPPKDEKPKKLPEPPKAVWFGGSKAKTDPLVTKIFKEYDTNKDGALDRTELANFTVGGPEHGSMPEDGDLPPLVRSLLGSEGVFNRFDNNRDDKLEPCDINDLIRSAKHAMNVSKVEPCTYAAHGAKTSSALENEVKDSRRHGDDDDDEDDDDDDDSLLAGHAKKQPKTATEMEEEIFKKYDKDGDGFLTPADLAVFKPGQPKGGPFPEDGDLPPLVRAVLGNDDLLVNYGTCGKISKGQLTKALQAAVHAMDSGEYKYKLPKACGDAEKKAAAPAK